MEAGHASTFFLFIILCRMKSLTDRLLEIKDKLAPLLQPITEAELYLLLHPQRKHEITSSVGVDEPSNPGLLAH